jgi:hypothetical protein
LKTLVLLTLEITETFPSLVAEFEVMAGIEWVPVPVLLHILSYLPRLQLSQMHKVNSRFRSVLFDAGIFFWRKVLDIPWKTEPQGLTFTHVTGTGDPCDVLCINSSEISWYRGISFETRCRIATGMEPLFASSLCQIRRSLQIYVITTSLEICLKTFQTPNLRWIWPTKRLPSMEHRCWVRSGI